MLHVRSKNSPRPSLSRIPGDHYTRFRGEGARTHTIMPRGVELANRAPKAYALTHCSFRKKACNSLPARCTSFRSYESSRPEDPASRHRRGHRDRHVACLPHPAHIGVCATASRGGGLGTRWRCNNRIGDAVVLESAHHREPSEAILHIFLGDVGNLSFYAQPDVSRPVVRLGRVGTIFGKCLELSLSSCLHPLHESFPDQTGGTSADG